MLMLPIEKKQETPNIERPTPNIELRNDRSENWVLSVGRSLQRREIQKHVGSSVSVSAFPYFAFDSLPIIRSELKVRGGHIIFEMRER